MHRINMKLVHNHHHQSRTDIVELRVVGVCGV